MAAKEEKKKPQNLDDFLAQMEGEHSKSLNEAFKAHDTFRKEDNLNQFYVRMFAPGQDALYDTLCSELDKAFEKKDDSKLKKTEEHNKVKKAVSKALRKYFEKVQPSLIKAVDDLKMSDEEQYDFFTQTYDEHVGAGHIEGVDSIKETIETLLKKKKTIGHIKKKIYDQKSKHAGAALDMVVNKYVSHHFNKYQPIQIASHLKPQLEKEGYEIEDKVGYSTANIGKLLGLRTAIVQKEGHPYLKKKEEKEEEKYKSKSK